MSDLENALQEFEDNAYHNSLHPIISVKALALAMVALKDMIAREKNKEIVRCSNCKKLNTENCPLAEYEYISPGDKERTWFTAIYPYDEGYCCVGELKEGINE